MEELKKKSNKGLIVFLVILVLLLLGGLGFGAYKYMELDKERADLNKKYENVQKEINSKTKEINQIENQNSYDAFIKKMKERRENVYNEGGSIEEHIEEIYTEYGDNVGNVTIKLAKDGLLSVTYKNFVGESGKIAENVLFFKVLNGDAGFQYLYYVTEDGKIYKTQILAYFPKGKPNEYSYKNIVDILPTKGIDNSDKHHTFVDIDGNLYN